MNPTKVVTVAATAMPATAVPRNGNRCNNALHAVTTTAAKITATQLSKAFGLNQESPSFSGFWIGQKALNNAFPQDFASLNPASLERFWSVTRGFFTKSGIVLKQYSNSPCVKIGFFLVDSSPVYLLCIFSIIES